MNAKFLICISLILLTACGKETAIDWELKEGNIPPLVVEGMLTNQRTSHLVKLSKPLTEINAIPEMISGANVFISDGVNHTVLQESAEQLGHYYTEPTVQGVAGMMYFLKIEYAGNEFWAADSMVPVTTEDPFNIVESDSNGFYQLQFFEAGNPAMIEIDLNWEDTPVCAGGSCFARQTYFVLYNIDVNKQFQADNIEKVLFPPGTELVRRKYSLSPLHQKYARSLLMETDWRGGYFDVLPGQVFTNVTNGAVGFFAACSFISDTVVVE